MQLDSLKLAAAVLVLASATPPLSAQQPPIVVTLGAVYRAVDSASPAIRSAYASVRAAESRVPGASRLPDPTVQLQLMNRNLPGLGLNDPLGMNQLQITQMVPLAALAG